MSNLTSVNQTVYVTKEEALNLLQSFVCLSKDKGFFLLRNEPEFSWTNPLHVADVDYMEIVHAYEEDYQGETYYETKLSCNVQYMLISELDDGRRIPYVFTVTEEGIVKLS